MSKDAGARQTATRYLSGKCPNRLLDGDFEAADMKTFSTIF
jgi:hypothetical protein